VAQQDAAISIAVIHHFATPERRLQAVHEMVRVIRRGGRGLIAVWAFEQAKASHHEQDVFVPWHLKPPAQPKAPRAKQPPRAKRRRATPADEPNDSSDSTTTARTTARTTATPATTTTTGSDEPASCSGSSEAVQEPLSVRAVQDGPCIAQGEAITTTQATFQVYQRCVPAGAPGLPSHRIASHCNAFSVGGDAMLTNERVCHLAYRCGMQILPSVSRRRVAGLGATGA